MKGSGGSAPLPAQVQRLLNQRVGLRLGQDDWSKLEQWLQARASRYFPNLTEYCASLPEPLLARELERAASQLTPGETYFFRDHGQFDLLRLKLLPELAHARRRRKVLRLWSAGCATGEEAYSLAMLVDMALPEREGWQVGIIGSDLNEDFLARARCARYGRWSFRQVPASIQQRYFRQEGEEWVLREDIRRMVTFHAGNLVAGSLPDSVFRDMDIILCRNVLIYLQPEAVGSVAGKLAACLADNGYLLTGHTELLGVPVQGLASRLFPEGVVYQRVATTPPPAQSVPQPAAPPARASTHTRTTPVVTAKESQSSGALVDAAQSLADRGEYQAADTVCRKALATQPLAPAPHFLLAQLAQLRGNYQEAETQLNRTLYLAPDHVAAYLELAAIHERAGLLERAAAKRRAALEILRRLPADTRVEPFEANAGQLAAWLEQTESL